MPLIDFRRVSAIFERAPRLDQEGGMSRDPRIYVPDGIYHCMTRGNRRQPIFEDARDRRRFAKILGVAAERHAVAVYLECQMGTHYHLVIRTPRANHSEFMGYLNGEFAKYSNRRHQRIGHLFGDRFKPVLVDTGVYLRVLVSYVLNNPVESGKARTAGHWKWSSYRALMGEEAPPPYLHTDWLDEVFPASSRDESRALLAQYVNAPTVEEAEVWFEKVVYGGDELKARIRALIAAKLYTRSVPRAYRALHRPALDELIPRTLSREQRNTAILRAHTLYAYPLADLARYLAMHPASVSRIICSVRPRGY
jgi:putative transposase